MKRERNKKGNPEVWKSNHNQVRITEADYKNEAATMFLVISEIRSFQLYTQTHSEHYKQTLRISSLRYSIS